MGLKNSNLSEEIFDNIGKTIKKTSKIYQLQSLPCQQQAKNQEVGKEGSS